MARGLIWLAVLGMAATSVGCKKEPAAPEPKAKAAEGKAKPGKDAGKTDKGSKADDKGKVPAPPSPAGSPAPSRPTEAPGLPGPQALAVAPTPAAPAPAVLPPAVLPPAVGAPAPTPALPPPPTPAPALAAREPKPEPAAEEPAAKVVPEAPQPQAPEPRSTEPALDVTGYLSLADLELALKKKDQFRRSELAGLAPNPGYNSLYFEPNKGDGFGIAVQVWRDSNLAESRTRFNTMRNTYPSVAPTSKVAEQGFRSFFGDVVTLVFADPRRPLVASVSCSKKHCTGDDLLYLATLVRDRLR